jgi:hypothetical protein
MADNDLVIILSSLLEDIPHVGIIKKFHNTSFLVGKKVFAFTKGDDTKGQLQHHHHHQHRQDRTAAADLSIR